MGTRDWGKLRLSVLAGGLFLSAVNSNDIIKTDFLFLLSGRRLSAGTGVSAPARRLTHPANYGLIEMTENRSESGGEGLIQGKDVLEEEDDDCYTVRINPSRF